jgi:hypothetical protein
MNASTSPTQLTQILPVDRIQRWEVYYRLQSLEIDCQCGVNQPLEVNDQSPLDIMQIWSIVRQMRSSRQELLDCLENCWQLPERSL